VSTLLFANGALFANLVPRYPELKSGLDLSGTAFGGALASYGFGALLTGLAAGALLRSLGSVRLARLSTLLLGMNLPLLGVAPTWLLLATTLFVAGTLDAFSDIAGNAHGLRVERGYRRPVLNAMHGVWSVGAVAGGAMGSAAAALDVPLVVHLGGAAVIIVLPTLLASKWLLNGPDERPMDRRRPTAAPPSLPTRSRWPVLRSVTMLGAIAAAAQVMEDVGSSWSAVYLREDLGVAPAVAGLGFVALQSRQTLGRLFGDRVVARYGDRRVARAGAALAGLSMLAALTVPTPATTIVALGAVGLGIGTLIPASMRAVDQVPSLSPGTGLMAVGTVLRVAVLTSSALIGIIADGAGLRVGLLVVPTATALLLLLSRSLPDKG